MLPFILAAIVVHLALLPLVPMITGLFDSNSRSTYPKNYQPVELVSRHAIKDKGRPKTAKISKEEEKEPLAKQPDGQVVELPPTLNTQEPLKDARYLAESNHRTL